MIFPGASAAGRTLPRATSQDIDAQTLLKHTERVTMGVSQEAKKAKKAARQKAAAEANAQRAAAFKAALAEGRDPNEAAAAVEDLSLIHI